MICNAVTIQFKGFYRVIKELEMSFLKLTYESHFPELLSTAAHLKESTCDPDLFYIGR